MRHGARPAGGTFPTVSVIIVNYNGRDLLRECLESVYAQSFRDIEIIVVDNGSQDGSVEYVKGSFPDVMVFPLAYNTGFPTANNEGLKHSIGGYILLLNNDVVVDKDCISNLYATMESDPKLGICATKMIVAGTDLLDSAGDGFSSNLKGFKRGEGLPLDLYNRYEYVFGACAGAAIYRRSMIDEIGFLDDDFFLIQEDTDLNFRAQLASWKVLFVPSAVVYHKVRSSIGHMSDTAIYYTLRNSEFVRIKNVPLGIAIRCLPSFVIGISTEFVYFVIKHKKIKLYYKAKKDALIKFPLMWKKRRIIMKNRKTTNKYIISIMTSVLDKEFMKAKLAKLFYG
jgi:GT2 family glycosyltransferase